MCFKNKALSILLLVASASLVSCEQKIPFNSEYISHGFDFPVGKPNAHGYYNAQGFGKNKHLGEDWNGAGGGNTDLGDPIYSIADGYVKNAKNGGTGWGNVLRIVHTLKNGKQYESLYAHCDKILVKKNTWVRKGQKIGTIGNVNGKYLAHLHFEIRNDINMGIFRGYSSNTQGYLNPTKFINANRNVSK